MTTTDQGSLWLTTSSETGYPELHGELAVDVAVVGGGVAGLTTALLLQQAGRSVAVLEADRVASGASGNNTAKVTALQATVYSDIAGRHGRAAAAAYATASREAVETVARLVEQEGIDCDLHRYPAITFAMSPDEIGAVEAETQAARDAGLAVRPAFDAPLPLPVHAAVRLDDQIALHPVRYLQGIAAALDGAGGQVFEQSRVLRVEEGTPCRVHTAHGVVRAANVVVATHYPILDRGMFFARLEAVRSYCIAATVPEPPEVLAINAGEPTRSVAVHNGMLVLGGEGHPAGASDAEPERYRRLEADAREHFRATEVTHHWSAQDAVSYDHLPVIGRYTPLSDSLFVASGFRKWGLSSGTFAARILADQILDRPNAWADTFRPHRVTLRSLPDLARLGGKVVVDFVGDRLRPGEVSEPEQVPAGEGRVLRRAASRSGLFRDDAGALHAVSLRCTHLGCLLRFNSAERSWDCPCHGSRFDVDGAVLEGPAIRPLAQPD